MDISEFIVGNIYSKQDLVDSFGGSFLRPRGITPLNDKNIIILISYHTGRNRYEDKLFENDIMLYSGEGLDADQKLKGRNKSIYEAKQNNRKLYLFVVSVSNQYKFYGEVEVVGECQYHQILGNDNQPIKSIRFPLMQVTSIRRMSPYEIAHLSVGGITPIEKPVIQVVGAAIVNEQGEVLCAQRGYGSLIGKWEFPGGKVESGETDQQALAREIKEELNIDVEVEELIDENYNEYKDKNINLKVYKCKYISGEINDTEHQSLGWKKPDEMESLDWAEADQPIVETYLDSLPKRIDGEPLQFDYFEAEAVNPTKKDIQRAAQDYEKAQRAKQKSGDIAEEAVLKYERDKLNNLGHPELAERVKQVSKESADKGYDVLSYDIEDNTVKEIHIEVKSATESTRYIEFFISENELKKFKEDENHKIYCLIKRGRIYKLHEVNKYDFFRNNYLSPMTYRVRIRVAE